MSNGDVSDAVAHLRQAITFDSGFAMAWRKLGVVFTVAGYSDAAADSATARAYHFRERLTPVERLITEGTYFMDGPDRDRARSIAAWDQLLALGDSLPTLNDEANMLVERREFSRAESLLRAAVRINHAPVAYSGLAGVQMSEGHEAEALATLDTLERVHPASSAIGVAGTERFLVYASGGEYARAQALVDTLLASSDEPTRANAHHDAMLLAAVEGRFDRVPIEMSATMAATPLAARTSPIIDSMMVAQLDATSRARPARAVARLDAALTAMPFSSLPPEERFYYRAATIYAMAGRPDKARAVMAQRNADIRDSARLRNDDAQVHRVDGEIALVEHRPNDAVREFWRGDSARDGPADDCDACTDFALARAYDKANQPDSATVYFGRYFASTSEFRADSVDLFARAPAARRLGELYEQAGNRAKAAQYYRMFVDLWKNADADVQPEVADMRQRLARLGKGRRLTIAHALPAAIWHSILRHMARQEEPWQAPSIACPPTSPSCGNAPKAAIRKGTTTSRCSDCDGTIRFTSSSRFAADCRTRRSSGFSGTRIYHIASWRTQSRFRSERWRAGRKAAASNRKRRTAWFASPASSLEPLSCSKEAPMRHATG